MRRRHLILGLLAVVVGTWLLVQTAGQDDGDGGAGRADATGATQPPPGLSTRGPGKGEAEKQDPTDADATDTEATDTEEAELDENEYRISGRILDAEGRPAMGEAFITDGEATDSLDFIMEDGRFACTQSHWGVYRILVILEGHVPWLSPWRREKPGERLRLGDIRMKRGLEISGIVRATEGPVLRQVVIEPEFDPPPPWWDLLEGHDSDFWTLVSSRADASFEFRGLPPGSYRLRVGWRESDEVIVRGVVAGTKKLAVLVPARPTPEPPEPQGPPFSLRFVVTGENGEKIPIGDAQLSDGTSTWGMKQMWTIEGHGTPPFQLFVKGTDRARLAPVMLAGIVPGKEPVRVTLGRGRTVIVTAKHLREDAHVQFWARGYLGPDGRAMLTSEHKGPFFGFVSFRSERLSPTTFRFAGLPEGTLDLTISGVGYKLPPEIETFDTSVGAITIPLVVVPWLDVEVTAPPGTELERVLIAIDQPIDGGRKRVADIGRNTKGRHFTHRCFIEDASRPHRVHVLGITAAGRLRPAHVEVPAGAEGPVRVKLRTGAPIRGRLVDTKGRPLPRTQVHLARPAEGRGLLVEADTWVREPNDDPEYPAAAWTGIDGRFEILGAGDGDWHLMVARAGYVQQGAPPIVRAGQSGLRVVLEAAQRISGWLRCADPEVVLSDFEVAAWPAERGAPIVYVEPVDGGFFEIPRLPGGRYTIVVRPVNDASWSALQAGVAAGTSDVELQLRPALTTTLDLRDAKGRRLNWAAVTLRGAFTDIEAHPPVVDGPFIAYGVTSGTYEFVVFLDGKPPIRIEVEAGTTTTYVVR